MPKQEKPKDSSKIPEVLSHNRGSLWNACYASAYITEFSSRYAAAWSVATAKGRTYSLDAFIYHNAVSAVSAAEQAKTLADTAVWALKEFDKSERDS